MRASEVRRGADEARRQVEQEARESLALYEGHRSDFDQPGPFPGRLVALICWRETRGRDVTSREKERGPMQLMDEETRIAGGGDPHSLRDSIRMRQILWGRTIARFPQRTSGDQLAVAILGQSLGNGATGWIVRRVTVGETSFVDRLWQWLQTTPDRPRNVSQGDYLWSLRIARTVLRVRRASAEAWFNNVAALPGTEVAA
jgi:hypothetical protein